MPFEKYLITAPKRETRETRLPPDNDLQVTYVVPIKGEIKNGNFFNQLKDFTRQRGEKNTFEIIYVVNNRENDVVIRSDEFYENQLLLSIVAFIADNNSEKLPDGLEDWQREIVLLAKDKGLRIQALDHSSTGLLYTTNTGNTIENARAIGEGLAIDRFSETKIGEGGGVVVLDADSRIDQLMTESIIEQLVKRDGVGMLRFGYDLIPGEGGEGIFREVSRKRFEHIFVSYLYDFLLNGNLERGKSWQAVKVNAMEKKDSESASGWQLHSRQPLRGDEVVAHTTRIRVKDRARKTGGAFGSMRLRELERSRQAGTSQNQEIGKYPVTDFFTYIYFLLKEDKISSKLRERIISTIKTFFPSGFPNSIHEEQLLKDIPVNFSTKITAREHGELIFQIMKDLLDDNPKELAELESTVATELRREKFHHEIIRGNIKRLVRSSFRYDHRLTVDNIGQILEARDENRNTAILHFLRTNTWILSALNKIREETSDSLDAMETLENDFPSFMLDFDSTEFGKSIGTILGLLSYLKKARDDKDGFPATNKLIGVGKSAE